LSTDQLKTLFNFLLNGLKLPYGAKTNIKLGHHLFLKLLSVDFNINFIVSWCPQKPKETQEE
jgi:hypothetical protein